MNNAEAQAASVEYNAFTMYKEKRTLSREIFLNTISKIREFEMKTLDDFADMMASKERMLYKTHIEQIDKAEKDSLQAKGSFQGFEFAMLVKKQFAEINDLEQVLKAQFSEIAESIFKFF